MKPLGRELSKRTQKEGETHTPTNTVKSSRHHVLYHSLTSLSLVL